MKKNCLFHQSTDRLNGGSETEKTSIFCSKKEQNSRIFYLKYVKQNAAIEYFPRFKRL